MSSLAVPSAPRLYVSYTCPYAHRTLLARALLGLESQVPLSVVAPYRVDTKWAFIHEGDKRFEGEITTVDPVVPAAKFVADVYQAIPLANWDNVNSVPYLIDADSKKGVSNGSADIVDILLKHPQAQEKLKAPHLAGLLNPVGEDVKETIKTYLGLFKSLYTAGASKTQEEYEEHVKNIQKAFATLEDFFKVKKFFGGETIAVQDILIFPFVFRWDYVHTHTSKYYVPLKNIAPNVARWVDDFIAVDEKAVKSTVRFNHIESGLQGYLSLPFTPHVQHKF